MKHKVRDSCGIVVVKTYVKIKMMGSISEMVAIWAVAIEAYSQKNIVSPTPQLTWLMIEGKVTLKSRLLKLLRKTSKFSLIIFQEIITFWGEWNEKKPHDKIVFTTVTINR